MKVVQINTFPYKATGNIMMNIHNILTAKGYDSYVCWGRGRSAENNHEIVISDSIGVKLHGLYTRLFDKTGFASQSATRRLITRLDEIQPNIIHLHNIHGYYVNIEMLFKYIRKNKIKVIWTLHDCWAFTGHCAWFDVCGCDKWKTGCNHCEQLYTYPASFGIDSSAWNWTQKKNLFTGLDITLVTPSIWLSKLVKQSFLKDYPVNVIHNGIDLNVFKPDWLERQREKYGLNEKPIILGVASEWTPRKGLNDLIEISKMMSDVQFVVVGLTDGQIKSIPNTIKGIKRTADAAELAGLYSIADLFFNPTYEDNFPTTNIEALACGTPVVTYNTGGSPEALEIGREKSGGDVGCIIKKNDARTVDNNIVVTSLRKTLEKVKSKEIDSTRCRVAASYFDMKSRLSEYLRVYDFQQSVHK